MKAADTDGIFSILHKILVSFKSMLPFLGCCYLQGLFPIFAGAFPQKTVKYSGDHMKDAKSLYYFYVLFVSSKKKVEPLMRIWYMIKFEGSS